MLKRQDHLIVAGTMISALALSSGIWGCRGGAGTECISDSDCEPGLVCLKREKVVGEKPYPAKWGKCGEDADGDGIADDGDFSGVVGDFLCGVHAFVHPQTGVETVKLEHLVIAECDDNCPQVLNTRLSRSFDCLARDSCCVLDENPEANREKKKEIDRYALCNDIEKAIRNTCNDCIAGLYATPSRCYLSFPEGYELDERGCALCQPLQKRISCKGKEKDFCSTHPDLPRPACSGRWTCEAAFCKFQPTLFYDQDENGYNIVYQLDKDWDGLGDSCDNCPGVANGFDCEDPMLEHRCDANGDGMATLDERALGAQANRDGDKHGDACDLCPDLADSNNEDIDGDSLGNPCDPDDDGDRICDPGQVGLCPQPTDINCCHGRDNCPQVNNPNQEDRDLDGLGDFCDPDRDADGIREDGDQSGVAGDAPCRPLSGPCCDLPPCNTAIDPCRNCDDNCPNVSNADQIDSNDNGIGDACE